MKKQPRSKEMIVVGYFLSKYIIDDDSLSLLNVDKWTNAYDLFYPLLGDGRDYDTFEHSLKNTRDKFDSHIDNTRRGWHKQDKVTPVPLTGNFLEIYTEYSEHSYQDLLNIVKTYIKKDKANKIRNYKEGQLLTSSLLSYIISTIKTAGGQADLKHIYKQVNTLSKANGVDYLEYYKDEKTYIAQVRRAICLHSSDSDIYKKNRPNLFKAPEEKGKGLWALRDVKPNTKKSSYKDFGEAPNDNVNDLYVFATKIRKGQPKFRNNLLKNYKCQCVISNCKTKEVLEAAHIVRHSVSGINHSSNGLLLRSDIHSLYDGNKIKINPKNHTIEVDNSLKDSEYWQYNGNKIKKDINGKYPSREFLKIKYLGI